MTADRAGHLIHENPRAVGGADSAGDGSLSVALVCPYSMAAIGGVQNQVLELAGWLTAHGHRASILAPDRPTDDLLAHNGLSQALYTCAGTAVKVNFNGSVAPIAPHAITRVRPWLDRVDPDVVHVHEPMVPGPSLLTTLLAGPKRAPVIGTFHATLASNSPGQIAGRSVNSAGWIARPLLHRLAAVTAVSATARDSARHTWGVDPPVLANGFRREDLLALPDAGQAGSGVAAEGRLRVSFLGRTDDPRKGLEVFRAAAPLIRQQLDRALPGVRVDLVVAGPGRGNAGPELRKLGELDAAGRVELLQSTRVLVAPNTGGESFGLVLAEAMAAGAEVVASDLPAFTALLDQGRLGHTFSTADPYALASTVVQVLTGELADLRGPARTATAAWSWEAIGPRIVDLYRAVSPH